MKRRLLNVLTVLSLLLLTATVGLLAASPFRHMEVCWQSRNSALMMGVRDGGIYVLRVVAPVPGWRAAVPGILDF